LSPCSTLTSCAPQIIAGDSAGGGLALATLMYLRDEGYPLPSGGVLMSPWVDLTMSCESWTTNRVRSSPFSRPIESCR